MAWVKLDDAMPHHPKVLAAGAQAFALDVAAICYSNKHGTDGLITTATLPAVLPSLSQPKKWAARLVEAGRWHEPGHDCPSCPQPVEGWRIHDVHDYQPTAEQQNAERVAARERMRRLRGERGGSSAVRANSDGTSSQVPNPGPGPVPQDRNTPQPPFQGGSGSRANGTNPRAIAKREQGEADRARRAAMVVGSPEWQEQQRLDQQARESLAAD